MITQDQLRDVIGATAYDRGHAEIGTIAQVYYDDDTDQPKWVTVRTGLFGTHESFVPVQGAALDRDGLTVAYDKSMVKNAPNIAEDGHLSSEEEQRLYRHYDLAWDATTVGHDVSGPTTDSAMTRSEERLRVGTEARETGRARLRKHVVTEQQQVDVPVEREEVRVERRPVTDADRGGDYDRPALSEEEHEVVLHAERPVVDTEVEAVERVRLGTETVRGTETVAGEVRKEEIDVDDAGPRRKRRD